MSGEWLEISIVVDSKWTEVITRVFYSLDVKGIAIEDPNDLLVKSDSISWDYADINIMKYKGKKSIVTGYFESSLDAEEFIKAAKNKIYTLEQEGYHIGVYEVINKSIYEKDWANNWKEYYKPAKISSTITVVPRWEPYEAEKDEIIIKMDPGMAFGTGAHETTRMCVKALEKYVNPKSIVFDIGTGSGILSIAASKLGAEKVTAVDLDKTAVEVAKDNISFNSVNNVEVLNGNLMDMVSGKADIIVANIMADIIMVLAGDIKDYLKDDGIFISSGIISSREEEVIENLKNQGYNIINVSEEGEWAAVEAKL